MPRIPHIIVHMKLDTKVPPVFLPDADQETVLQLSLRSLNPCEWICVDDDHDQFLANKIQTLDAHGPRVYSALPGSE